MWITLNLLRLGQVFPGWCELYFNLLMASFAPKVTSYLPLLILLSQELVARSTTIVFPGSRASQGIALDYSFPFGDES
jgi:hypothetical protein